MVLHAVEKESHANSSMQKLDQQLQSLSRRTESLSKDKRASSSSPSPSYFGTSDGQTKVVREGDNGVAYSWNARDQTWDKILPFIQQYNESMQIPIHSHSDTARDM